MDNDTIFTDAAADLPLEWYDQYGILGAHTGPDMLSVCFWGKKEVKLSFRFNGISRH